MTPAHTDAPALIAGGGIAGLTLALTCHQIGVPVVVLESVRTLSPLGVGINLQPNAIRELIDLGLGDELDRIGLEATEWALVARCGKDVWAEPRGRAAGYAWPQYAVHRGKLQMLLYKTVVERLGVDAVRTGHRVVGYRNDRDGVDLDTAGCTSRGAADEHQAHHHQIGRCGQALPKPMQRRQAAQPTSI